MDEFNYFEIDTNLAKLHFIILSHSLYSVLTGLGGGGGGGGGLAGQRGGEQVVVAVAPQPALLDHRVLQQLLQHLHMLTFH